MGNEVAVVARQNIATDYAINTTFLSFFSLECPVKPLVSVLCRMSWGHDEYIYQVTKNYMPLEAQYMLRFHSFYPAHREHEYQYLMDNKDREYFKWIDVFNKDDLYTKSAESPNVDELRPFYEDLISEFFPNEITF